MKKNVIWKKIGNKKVRDRNLETIATLREMVRRLSAKVAELESKL
jgi:hypothetical protein